MKHIGLFEGIGGFSLAAEWIGWETIAWCEINEFCQKILKHYWPNAKGHGDIKTTDFSIYRGFCDIVTGGFPCQPYSAAGKRKGKEDERHLWPEMLRAIREIQPRWVVGENVSGLLNWNRGMVLDEIKADLEAAGFEVFPPLVLPACAVNAPHRRDRLWIIAHSTSNGGQINGRGVGQKAEPNKRKVGVQVFDAVEPIIETRVATDTAGGRLQRGLQNGQAIGIKAFDYKGNWMPISKPGIFGGNARLPNRMDRTKALGNAIVPQVVYEIFKAIEQNDQRSRPSP